MTTDTNPWAQAYLIDLDRAAATLPADRRAEPDHNVDFDQLTVRARKWAEALAQARGAK